MLGISLPSRPQKAEKRYDTGSRVAEIVKSVCGYGDRAAESTDGKLCGKQKQIKNYTKSSANVTVDASRLIGVGVLSAEDLYKKRYHYFSLKCLKHFPDT